MHEKRGNTGDFRRLQRAPECVTQQGRSKSGLMVFLVNGETAQHHHRYGVRPVAAQSARSIDVPERTGGKAVVANNGFVLADDIGAGRTAGLVTGGTSLQPVV